MTREDIEQLNIVEPHHFETEREEEWYLCGLKHGIEMSDNANFEPLRDLTIENLMEHCIKQCRKHKASKIGYEHYIFLQCLKELNKRDLEDFIIDYEIICKE